jgi:alpha-galactosidase
MLGNALPNTDPATLALITNDEVLAINQDKLAAQARRILQHLGTEIWIKNLTDGSQAIGFFNRDKESQDISLTWKDFGMKSPSNVRDLWEHKDLGSFPETFTRTIPSHGSGLYLVPAK